MKKTNEIAVDIWKSHRNYLGRKSATPEQLDIVDFLAKLFCPGPNLYYVIDSPTLELETVGGSVQELLGLEPEELTVGNLISRIHPDDADFFLKCEDVVAFFLKNCVEPARMTDYKIVSCLRLLTANGSYRLFLLQTITLRTTREGALLKVFGSLSDIGDITGEQNYRLSLIDMKNEKSCMEIDVLQNNLLDGYKPFEYTRTARILTKRQLEIARLLARGHSTSRIADELGISAHTVFTHRKNMLKKTGKSNSAELIADCIRKGYI